MGRHPITNEQIIPETAILKAAEGVTVPAPIPVDPSVSPILYGFGQESYSYQGHYVRTYICAFGYVCVRNVDIFFF